MIITDYAIKNRTTVFVLMLVIALVGGYAYMTLPREAAPDIQVPYVIVTITYPGVAPQDMENLVTDEVERRLKNISDVDKITSESTEGVSNIVVKFLPSTDIDQALQKVRDKVNDAKADMPDDIDEPVISEINFSEFPIMLLNLHGPMSLLAMNDIAKDLRDDIEKIDGVLSANISGALTRQIRLEVDPLRLAAYQIPVNQLFARIAAENQNVSGGTLDMPDAKYSTRVEGEFKDPSEIYDIIVTQVGGKPVYLRDVARVSDAFEDRTSFSRFNGQPSITLSVVKRAGRNIVEIADEVGLVVDRYRAARLPTEVNIDTTMDASTDIRLMVTDLENSMLTGLLLVILVLMVTLGLRNSLIAALAIPFSMLITFIVLQAFGITLNMIVLFSLILVSGMLVDDAIVIVENIYRHAQEGKSRVQAAMDGTREVGWAVVTSTLTTVAAFLPMQFWTGIIGEFMGYLPKTVNIALLASLFVALVINPTLSSILVKPRSRRPATMPGQGGAASRAAATPAEAPYREHWFVRGYAAMLRGSLSPVGKPLVLILAAGALVGSGYLFVTLNGRVEFFPQGDPRRATIDITMPIGTPLEATNQMTRSIEKLVYEYRTDHKDPARNVQYVTVNVGSGGTSVDGFGGGGGSGDTNRAQISMDFIAFEERDVPSMTTIDQRLRPRIADLAGADIAINVAEEGPPAGKPIEIDITGDEYEVLVPLAEKVKRIVKEVPGVTDLDDDYNPGKPELRVVVDRQKAALMNLSTAMVANTLKAAMNGMKVSKFREGKDDYDIVVRLPEESRRRIDQIEALTVAGPQGEPIPLSNVARIEYTSGMAAIKRTDQKRTITVSGEIIQGSNANQILALAREGLKDLPLPAGYALSYTGEQEEQNKAFEFLVKAGLISLLLIALILITEFNSVLLPGIIMIQVVLSWIGVFLALTIGDYAFSIIMTGIGVISLAGVVVKNGIVLIDYTEKLRARGLEVYEATVKAGCTRLRPVLLTATTSILGLVPMAIGVNLDLRNWQFNTRSESAMWWSNMSTVIIFGLATATLLTLLVVPILYVLFERLRNIWKDQAHHSDQTMA